MQSRLTATLTRRLMFVGALSHLAFEVANPDSGDAIVVLDLAWPDGLQEDLS